MTCTDVWVGVSSGRLDPVEDKPRRQKVPVGPNLRGGSQPQVSCLVAEERTGLAEGLPLTFVSTEHSQQLLQSRECGCP